jgi:2-iminobutanoate/2-iminopropanoate deaminase
MTPKRVIRTDAAPGAIGPYSQAVVAGNLLFVSGQIPLDPATGEVVPGGVEEQVKRILENLEAILKAAGSGLDRVVRTTVFLVDLGEFPRMNEVYRSYFPAEAPARTTVEVSALPRGVRVEIDAIAMVG